MKTSKKAIAIFALSAQLLCGCMTLGDIDDRLMEKEDQYFDQLTDAHVQNFMSILTKRDEGSFCSLFCETVKKADASFPSSVSDFFQFYQGKMVRYKKADIYILDSTSKIGKYYLLYFMYQFYIYTDVANYHIAYYVSLLDEFDADNEGIWSFKVCKFGDEEPKPINWYDEEWLDGIHIFEEEL